MANNDKKPTQKKRWRATPPPEEKPQKSWVSRSFSAVWRTTSPYIKSGLWKLAKWGSVLGIGVFVGSNQASLPQWQNNVTDIAKTASATKDVKKTWHNMSSKKWFTSAAHNPVLFTKEACTAFNQDQKAPDFFQIVEHNLNNRNFLPIPHDVDQAIIAATASQKDLYNLTAMVFAYESSLGKHSKAATSSATGIAQFVDQTWMEMIQRHADELPLYKRQEFHLDPKAIQTKVENKVPVYSITSGYKDHTNALMKAARKDHYVSSFFAAKYMLNNLKSLKKAFPDRILNFTDAYLTHFLGLGGAKTFIRLLESNPNDFASKHKTFTRQGQVKANPHVFFEDGKKMQKERTLGQVYTYLQKIMTDMPLMTLQDPNKIDLINAQVRKTANPGHQSSPT